MDFRSLVNRLERLDESFLGKSHLEHPEDLVFHYGVHGAEQALDLMLQTIQYPRTITTKYDGFPALIWGRDDAGKFSIMDKHMFNRKDGTGRQIYSPEDFVEYDSKRNISRDSLYGIISNIWPGLERSMQDKGYFWGDLLFGSPVQPQNGVFTFKANPNGITYVVDQNSIIGELITDKVGLIAVHHWVPSYSVHLDIDAESLDGGLGAAINNSNVALLPTKLPIVPVLVTDTDLVQEIRSMIERSSEVISALRNTDDADVMKGLFTSYANYRVRSGNLNNMGSDFLEYIAQKRPSAAHSRISEHVQQNNEGVMGAFAIWSALYALKMNIVSQLDTANLQSPIRGYLDNGTQAQEGYVANGIKLVNRLGFSMQNLNGSR